MGRLKYSSMFVVWWLLIEARGKLNWKWWKMMLMRERSNILTNWVRFAKFLGCWDGFDSCTVALVAQVSALAAGAWCRSKIPFTSSALPGKNRGLDKNNSCRCCPPTLQFLLEIIAHVTVQRIFKGAHPLPVLPCFLVRLLPWDRDVARREQNSVVAGFAPIISPKLYSIQVLPASSFCLLLSIGVVVMMVGRASCLLPNLSKSSRRSRSKQKYFAPVPTLVGC